MFCFADCLFNRCRRYEFKASSCVPDADLRLWKTSLLGHELSFSLIRRDGGDFTGQPGVNTSASGKDRPGQCLRLGWPTAGGRPLHPSAIKRRVVGQDFAQLSELLDFSHLFFTQEDVNALTEKYGPALDDDILLGNLKPAYEIYDLYQKRVDERVAKVKEILKQPMDFKTTARLIFGRKKAPWPKDEAEADELWRGRIASELLQENLSEHPIEPGPQLVARRYDRLARNVHERIAMSRPSFFSMPLRSAYDPHSEYLSKADLKNFQYQHGTLARWHRRDAADGRWLRQNREPGAGGPAQVDGRLKVGDRITAVGQGTAEFVDVRDMRLDKVVEMIRGKKGTKVRLLVIPADAADPSKRKNDRAGAR